MLHFEKVSNFHDKSYRQTNRYSFFIQRPKCIILKADRAIEAGAMESKINAYVAEARFHRACAYAKMSSKYGDVPLVVDDVDIDKGMSMGRTDLATVKQFVYDEFDAAEMPCQQHIQVLKEPQREQHWL